MFIGDFEKAASWSANAVKGCKRFLDRVWTLGENVQDDAQAYSPANASAVHKTIKKVTFDIDNLKPNTAIAALMTPPEPVWRQGLQPGAAPTFLQLLSPSPLTSATRFGKTTASRGFAPVSPWPPMTRPCARDAEIGHGSPGQRQGPRRHSRGGRFPGRCSHRRRPSR